MTRLVCGLIALAGFLTLPGPTAAAEEQPTEIVDVRDMSQVPRWPRKALFRAIAYEERGDWEGAARVLQDHLRDHPDQDHTLIRFHLGRSLDALGSTEPAREAYRRAVDLEPRLAEAWFGLGDTSYALRDYATAASAFLRGYRASADPPADALYYAAACYLEADQPEQAVPLLEELVAGTRGPPEQEWLRALVRASLAIERPEIAAPHLEMLVANRADDPDVWYLRYQFETGRQRYEAAVVALTIVGYLRELTSSEQRALGDLYQVVGVPELAGERYAEALEGDADAGDFARLATAFLAAHDTDRALQYLKQGVEVQPTADLWSFLGDVHYRREEYPAAQEAFRQVLALDPDRGRAYLMLGTVALNLGQLAEAIPLLERATTFREQAEVAAALLRRATRH